jgi:hypothetical protein
VAASERRSNLALQGRRRTWRLHLGSARLVPGRQPLRTRRDHWDICRGDECGCVWPAAWRLAGKMARVQRLEAFWREVSSRGAHQSDPTLAAGCAPGPLESRLFTELSLFRCALEVRLSPYEFNPLNFNPLRDIVERTLSILKKCTAAIRFEAVHRSHQCLYRQDPGLQREGSDA